MENQQVSYCRAYTLRDRMMFFEDKINDIVRKKQEYKRTVGYRNGPLIEFDRELCEIRTEQQRVYNVMTGATPVQEAEYEIIN